MSLEELPGELLLIIAQYLPDSTAPKHLKNLCLTSRKLRPIAQEALFTTARPAICCGCHEKVNALVKLLRTVLDRPDLAAKVKSLRFRAVRKRVEKMYAEQGFELLGFRDRCIAKVEEMGFQSSHPWWRSINNCVESAFGGLLLALLPNLSELDFWIKDHQRGPPSSECISGLWGATSPPEPILSMWKNVRYLTTGDTSMLKCGIDFEKLTALDLRTVSIGTALRLNGPGSLHGAQNLKTLALTVSIQFADRPLVNKADVSFSDLLEAMEIRALIKLKISFINDGYHIGDDMSTELSGGYFLDQLHDVANSLETLSITIETTDEDGELEWLVDMCQHPTRSMKAFTALKSLCLPQSFLFNSLAPNWVTENNCKPVDLPPSLEQLELLWPHEGVEIWAQGFMTQRQIGTSAADAQPLFAKFKKLILTCRDDAGIGAAYFTEDVSDLWWDLSTSYGIETEVRDQHRGDMYNLARLYVDENGTSIDDDDNIVEDSSENEEEGEHGRISRQHGSRGTLRHTVRQDVGLQTDILQFSRTFREDGVSVSEIAESLAVSKRRVRDAIRALRNAGNVLAPSDPDFVGNFNIVFVEPSLALQVRLEETGELALELDEDQSLFDEIEDDLDQYIPWSRQRLEMPDPPPSAVSAVRIAILRALRDLPAPSVGMTEATLIARFHHIGPQATESGFDTGRLRVLQAIAHLQGADLIESNDVRAADGTFTLVFVRDSTELLSDDYLQQIRATDALMREDDHEDWEDDDMPDLERFGSTSGATIGAAVAPLSRVGLITETAVLRLVRQHGLAGVAHEEIASRLGTTYGEAILRVDRLRRKGHVREDADCEKVYFVSEKAELREEDLH